MNTIQKGILAACVFFIVSILFSYIIFRKIYWVLSFGIAGALLLDVFPIDRWQRNVSGTPGGKTHAGKDFVYEESAPYSNSIKAIITLIFAVLAFSYFFAVFGHLVGSGKVPEQGQLALLLAASLYALIMWGFFSMKFRITGSGVEALMPPFKSSIPFSEIKDIKTIENIPWYVGWGVRLWGRRLAFVSMRKSAVVIEKKKGFLKKLILTAREPEEFARKIKERLA